MEKVEMIGMIAAILTTASFMPQAFKAIKTKDTKGLSLTMYGMLFIGVILWLVYGVMMNAMPIILANAVTFVLAGTIIILKLKYK